MICIVGMQVLGFPTVFAFEYHHMHSVGVEPTRLTALHPKCSASASSATSAITT